MSKLELILDYDTETSMLTDDNGQHIATWAGLEATCKRPLDLKVEEIKSPETGLDAVLKLRAAGFDSEEIIKMIQGGVVA